MAFLVIGTRPFFARTLYRPCRFENLTGLGCPFCDGTLAVRHLLRGRWSAAWDVNPLVIAVLCVLILLWAYCLAAASARRVPVLRFAPPVTS